MMVHSSSRNQRRLCWRNALLWAAVFAAIKALARPGHWEVLAQQAPLVPSVQARLVLPVANKHRVCLSVLQPFAILTLLLAPLLRWLAGVWGDARLPIEPSGRTGTVALVRTHVPPLHSCVAAQALCALRGREGDVRSHSAHAEHRRNGHDSILHGDASLPATQGAQAAVGVCGLNAIIPGLCGTPPARARSRCNGQALAVRKRTHA